MRPEHLRRVLIVALTRGLPIIIEVDEDDFAELECMRSTFNKLGRLIPSLYPAGDDALPTKASSVYKVRWENSDLQSAAQSAFIQTAGVVNATVGIPKILVGGANIVKDSKYAAKGFMTILKWVFKGEGDGQRNRIFADAYGKDPEFFGFYRAMQAYETALIGGDTSVILSPDSEFFKFFGNIKPKK